MNDYRYIKCVHACTYLRPSAPKGAKPVNYTSVIDWQMGEQRDTVINSTLRQVY